MIHGGWTKLTSKSGVEVSLSGGGFNGQHVRLHNEAKRDGKAAARFFRKVLKPEHTQAPRVVTVDKNAAYPVAMEVKGDETLAAETNCGKASIWALLKSKDESGRIEI